MRRRPERWLTAAGAAALILAGCTSTTSGRGAPATERTTGPTSTTPSARTSPPPTVTPTRPSSTAPANSCGRYADPDPGRPRMALRFAVSADHHTVDGTERVTFRPDRPVREVVFRLTANTRPTVRQGNRVVVRSARADHGTGRWTFSRANAAAGTQGGLLHIPLAGAVAAGTAITATVTFRLTLGGTAFDRFGRAGAYAYFGSGEPLLAWERGVGWHTEGLLEFPAESATSEAMDVDLTVLAPARDTVIMSGDPADPPPAGEVRTWHSTIAAARDVSVAVGPFHVSDTTVDGVRLRIGADTAADRDALVPEFHRAIRQLARLFGPFPFPSLSVARLPAEGGGIEYPSSILMLNSSRRVAVHETAHQWFYAMVGNSQALHPWLDEAFAEYAEELVDNDRPHDGALLAPGPVDASVESYGSQEERYYFITYNKGADALFAARGAAGPARWDAALRCYVARNAWRVAAPADLATALRQLPAAVTELRRAGALR